MRIIAAPARTTTTIIAATIRILLGIGEEQLLGFKWI